MNPSTEERDSYEDGPTALRDPRVQLVWSWVGLATTPLFLLLFIVLAVSENPWVWFLVAGVLASVPFSIRDVIRYAGAFRS